MGFSLGMVMALLAAADDPTKDAAKRELEKLQGTWVLVGGESSGRVHNEEEAKNGNIVGNKSRDAYLLVVSARRLHRGRKNCPGSTAPFEISGQLHREVSRRSIETESSSCM